MRILKALAALLLWLPSAALAQGQLPAGNFRSLSLSGPLTGTTGAFSGTLSAAGTVSGAGFTALLSPYALASSDALKLPLAGGTLTGPLNGTTGAFTTLNTTGGYQINGVPIFGALTAGGNNASIFAGVNAGAALGPASNFSTFYGSSSGTNYNDTGSGEVSCFATGSCFSMTLGATHNTGIGVYAMHYEVAGSQNVGVGGDVMRNTIGVNAGTAIGSRAHQNFFGQNSVAAGAFALYGNSASILFGGTITAGDVITLTFTSASISGGAVSVPYTVVGGNTLASIRNSLSVLVDATAALVAADIRIGGDVNASPFVLPMVSPSTSVLGTAPLVVTASVSGAATETVTITGGTTAAATSNNAFGFDAMMGLRMTSASFNNGMGRYVLANLTSGSHNSCGGDSACQFGTTLTTTSAWGDSAFKNATTAFALAGLGSNVGANCTTCRNVTLLGSNAGASALTNGNDIIILSDGSACDSNTVNQLLVCGSGGVVFNIRGTNAAATSLAMFPGAMLVGSATFSTAPLNGDLVLVETTNAATAPGAGTAKLEVVAGTGVGTCKLLVFAGSSATPVVLADNIGSGC